MLRYEEGGDKREGLVEEMREFATGERGDKVVKITRDKPNGGNANATERFEVQEGV